MKLKVLCYMLCAFGLHILPAFCEGNTSVNTTQSPLIIKLSYSIIKTYTILPPGVNRATIEVLTQKVILQTNNYTGIWQRPDDTNTTDDKIEFPIFTVKFNGLYRFYRTYQNGSQLLGIQIYISVSGTNFAQVLSNGEYALLSGNNIFYSDTTLVCATNDTFQHIQWQHKGIGELNYTDILDSAFNSTIGISELKLNTTRQGYYRCTVMTIGTTYAVGIFNKEVTRKVLSNTNFGHYTKQVDPQEVQLLCLSNNISISLKDIVWNELGNTLQNPLILNTLKIGYHTLTCNGVNENVEVTVTIQGPPNITLSTSDTFLDLLPDSINKVYVPVLTQNVLIQANLIGKWQFPDTTNNSNSTIHISYFTANHVGIYSFYVIGWNSTELLAIRIRIYATGTSFGEIMSQKIYIILPSYTLFNSSKTLFCATNDTSQQIQWTHKSNLDTNIADVTESSIMDNTTGISTLDIATSQQGYYTCIISEGTSYTVGIFNPDITIEIRKGSTGDSYVYTRGIDPSDLQLLCISDDTNIAFSKINWFSLIMLSQNPLILDSLPNMDGDLLCYIEGPKLIIIRQLVQGPPTIMLSNTTQANFSSLLSNANTAALRVLTQNVTLQTNLIGMWHRPDSTVISNNNFTYSVFTANLAGLYTFNVSDWKGNQVIAIAITISATGSNFAEKFPAGDYRLLDDNNIFYTARTLVCVTNDTSHEIQWIYQPTQDATDVIKTATWNADTGISELFITTTEQGYYECEVMSGGTIYTAAIFNPDITYVATGIFYYYIKGIDPTNIQILCDPKDTTIALSSIKLEYSGSEFNNPLIINEAGSISGSVICEFGSSRFGLILTIQEPSLTFTYTGYAMQYNTLSPSTTPITIPLLSSQVTLIINDIVSGTWNIPRNTLEGTTLEIPIFTLVSTGRYTFNSTDTWDGMEKEVFIIDISPIGDAFALMNSVSTYAVQSNNPFFYTDTTLLCLTDYETQVNWYYRVRTQADKQVITTPNTDTSGISRYTAMISQPGFYSCEGINYGSAYIYTAGVFNANNSRVAVEGASYFYTIGIDREEAELLCDPMNSSIDLNTVEWFRKDFHTNPLELSNNIHPLVLGESEIHCFVPTITDIRLTANLTIQNQPVIEVAYLEESTSSTLYQYVPIIIPLLTNNTVISSNLVNGIWRFNYSNDITNYGSNTEYRVNLFTANNIGVYEYIFANFYEHEEIIQVALQGTGSGLGMESDAKITTVMNNTIFYQNTLTLVAASNKRQLYSDDIVWTQQISITDSDIMNISGAMIDSTKSLSRLNLDTLSNGYYTVVVKDNNSMIEQYVVGVFKTDNIYDTREVEQLNYTSGVDSVDLEIICIPPTFPILANIKWAINGSLTFSNPIKLQVLAERFLEIENATFKCLDVTNTSIEYESIHITIKEPPSITLSYLDERNTSVLALDRNTFDIMIQVFTKNILFECNKPSCIWRTYGASSKILQISNETTFTIPFITIQNYKYYNLSTEDTNGEFIPSVFIRIIPIGTAFQRLTLNGSIKDYQTVTTNSIINLEENTTLVCVSSYVNVIEKYIKWFYQETGSQQFVSITGKFNNITGLSKLTVNEAGFYTCQVPDEFQNFVNYSVGVYSIANETMKISHDNLQSSKEVNFVLGKGLKLFYQNETIPIGAIRWGIQRIEVDESSFLMEYLNPVDVNIVFNGIGNGAFKFNCFYRQSPITNVGNIRLNLKDTASLTVQYGQVEVQFSDADNPLFPVPEDISIPIVTKDVSISCSLPSCVGVILKNGTGVTELSIQSLRIENAGIYALIRTTTEGVNYTTASFYLIVEGYIEQSIASLTASIINETSVRIFWFLESSLPDNAMETFCITYKEMGNTTMQAASTTDLTYNLTGLMPGVTYIIRVELSYAYTTKTSNKSVEVTIPFPTTQSPILQVILAIVFAIVAVVTVLVVLIIICIVFLLKRKGNKFETLESDEVINSMTIPKRLSQGYAPLSTPLNNPIYNPELTESILQKSKFRESVHSQNENYQNLQDIKDPRLKPIPLTLFKQTMEKLWEKENTLEEEYRSLGGDMLRYECRNAQIDKNRIKNKYKLIYPYDKSRVVLTKLGKDPLSDYINASYIPGLYVTENFIASQGPKENTIQDLWRMVFEKKILNIVMVTNCVEGGKLKCEEYFPMNEGKTAEFGQYKVKNTFTNQCKGHIVRKLNITSTKGSVEVKHFHFTAWPDHDVPSLFDELLQFVGFVQENTTGSDAPILVHCSAGVGRTGTFITLFNLRSAIQKGQPICIYQLVNEMREHRPHMVQTFRQYKFIYLAVLELLLDKTAIPVGEFNNIYRAYLESDQEGYVSVFFQQFSELNFQCQKSFTLSCSEGENNEFKNPKHDILPFDNNRVVIYSPHFQTNYINASYHENNLFITSQNPIANTVCDFLQMIYQTDATLVIMLTTSKEKSKILANMSDRKPYWPNKEGILSVPPFQVEVVSSEKSTAMIKQKVTLRNMKDNSERTFLQILSTTWNDKSDPTDLQSVVTLLQLILKHRQDNPNSTIIMHCNDGISNTGIVLTIYQCIRNMQETGEVDIFHTIKRMRRERMNLVPTLSNFLACFALMNEYCSST